MGLLNEIGSLMGNSQPQGDAATGAPDPQTFQNMVSNAHPGILSQVFSHVAQQMNPQDYASHMSPSNGGGNPLSSLGSGGLGTIASALLGKLTSGGGYNSGSLLSRIPGLRTTDQTRWTPIRSPRSRNTRSRTTRTSSAKPPAKSAISAPTAP